MKRSRKESKAMDTAILDMFADYPETKLVENRYRAIRVLLMNKYSKELLSIEKIILCRILFDAITFDRKLRLWTQGEQKELKKELSDQFIVDELM
jgi:hypothetical protein